MKVFKNGKFISCGIDSCSFFSVLVEEDGKIAYIGDQIPEKYAAWEQIDLEWKCVVPCFGDTHVHYIFEDIPIDPREEKIKNIPDFLQFLRKKSQQINDKILYCFGISTNALEERRLPTKAELDSAVSRPLYVHKYDGHAGVLNSAMIDVLPLEIRNMPDLNKETGLSIYDANIKIESWVSDQVYGDPNVLRRGLASTANRYLSAGFNLVVPTQGTFDSMKEVHEVESLNGKSPLRIRAYFQTMNADVAIQSGHPRIGGCFDCMLDGCFGAQDAALREPYSNNPSNKGILFFDQNTVNEFIKKVNRSGANIGIHAIGDAAIEQLIIAFEEALRDYPRQHRHFIIHGDLFPQDYLERAGKLGLYCAVQTEFLDWAEEPLWYLKEIIGDRAYEKHPLTKMIAAGLTLANGTDGPCTWPNGLRAIHTACNHPKPEYSVDPLTALRMSTLNPARLTFDDQEMGSLEVGKVADFVVLDRHLLEVPRQEIQDIQICDIYHGGIRYSGQYKF